MQSDALGRAAETWTTLTGDQAAYSVKTFDVLGRVVTESNPVAVTVNPVTGTWNTDGSAYVTTSAYDALGRVVAQTAPGGFTVSTAFGLGTARDIVTGAATIPATTERVTEQVGGEARWRQLYRDAFGRIVQVDECLPDGVSGQQRVFDYNAAGWLTAVQLPEYACQEMRYAYDDLGNVTAKTLVSAGYGSPLGYAETLAYDALSRLTARTVTLLGTTTWHTFTYDGGAVAAPPAGHPGDFAWGRLTHDRTTYGLDPGAVAVERFVRYNWQGLPEEKAERFGTLVDEDTVAGEEFVTAYTATDPDQDAYDRQGNLLRMIYPSGQAVEWEYQNGGTMAAVSAGGRAIFSNLAYAAHGAVAGMQLGDAATGQAGWGQAFDAARLWPVRIVAGTTAVTANTTTASGAVLFGLDYDNYEANGNIAAVTRKLRLVANGTQYTLDFGYSYDRLNRLAGCAVTDTVYTYAMDEFGNITARTQAAGGGGQMPMTLSLAVSRGTNQLTGDGYYHDVLGNLVTMPAADGVGTVSMTYLDQGHIGTLTDAAGVVWKYYYDADGKRRIKVKTAGGAATEPDGQGGVRLVADRSYYFYEGENLICQQDIGALVQDESQYEPKFLLLDHLGSTRAELVFDPVSLAPQIQEYYDLMPYGEVIDAPTTQESVLFTGKPRDIESGLDQMDFRSYENLFGRFLSPDPLLASAKIEDPQSWNRYLYARNNPLRYVDTLGLFPSPAFKDLNDEQKRILENSKVKIEGKELSGETLWDALGKQKNGEALQNAFINVTDRLGSITFADGKTALSAVSSISSFEADRVKANLNRDLAGEITTDNRFETAPGALHPGFDFMSYKSKDTEGNIQFSFAPPKTAGGAPGAVDIDHDLYRNWRHGLEVLWNLGTGSKTDQDQIRRILIRKLEVTITPSPDPRWNRKR